MELTLAQLNEAGSLGFPGFVGIEVDEAADSLVRARLALRDEHLAPNGYLHAGVVITLADTACGYGCVAHLPDDAANFTTIELKANFLGTARDGAILCRAVPLHRGRTTQIWDATVTLEATGAKIAVFRCTQMVLWPK